MNVSNRKILPALLGIVVCAGISLSASSYQDDERSYSLEGAWLCEVALPAGTFHYMDTYTSDSDKPGVSGTVLCSLPLPDFVLPALAAGPLHTTESGQGNWIRIGKNQFAATVNRIIIDSNGVAVGLAKYWGIVTAITQSEFSGTLQFAYYDFNGTLVKLGRQGISTGKRIEVEFE